MIDLLIYEGERLMYLNDFELAVAILTSVNVYFLFMLIIALCFHRQIGLQLFLLATFSLYLSYFSAHLHFLEQSGETNLNLMPLININILIISVFFFYLIPVVAKKRFSFVAILFIVITSVIYSYYYDFATWDLVFTVVLGLFIVYTFYRSLDWVGSLPEQSKLLLIFFISLCLFLLSMESAYLVGLMFSLMFAMHLEQLKIGSKISKTFPKLFIAFVIGASGYYFFQFISYYLGHLAVTHLLQGMVVGFWLGYFTPLILVTLHVYERFRPTYRS